MGPPVAVLSQDLVRLGDEVPIGEKQELHALAQFLLAKKEGIGTDFYVSHVDIYART
jgi:hypothetical protein